MDVLRDGEPVEVFKDEGDTVCSQEVVRVYGEVWRVYRRAGYYSNQGMK